MIRKGLEDRDGMYKREETEGRWRRFIFIKEETEQDNEELAIIQNPGEEMSIIKKDVEDGDVLSLLEKMDMLGSSPPHYESWDGGNILHGVLRAWKIKHNQSEDKDDRQLLEFVEEVLQKFPILIWQTDIRGDTPFHIIARDYEISDSLLVHTRRCYIDSQQGLLSGEEIYCPAWRVKNVKGNTPLHEALFYSERPDTIVRFLSEKDKDAFASLNNQNETPLHMLCAREDKAVKDEDLIKLILDGNSTVLALFRDVNGMTPLLRAAQKGNLHNVVSIYKICPDSVQIRDNDGRNFWHMMVPHTLREDEDEELLRFMLDNNYNNVQKLLDAKDCDYLSPVEEAIKNRQYGLLKFLLKCPNLQEETKKKLKEAGIDMKLYFPFLSASKYLSREMQHILWRLWNKAPHQSLFDVQDTEVSTYTQTLSVIAVLLATIAFTAAFTVPGGFRQEHQYFNKNGTSITFTIDASGATDPNNISTDLIGSPVLLGSTLIPFLTRASYYVFMVSDILTMCLSTFVLYCLMWVMKNSESKMIVIDMSIFTLQICFYTTMVTFMSGIFATTFRIIPSLAISTMVFCSVVMVLMNRWLYPSKIGFTYGIVAYLVFIEALEECGFSVKCGGRR